MTLVIEEQKSKSTIIAILIWVVFIGLVALGAFYVFFKKPDLIQIPPPSNFTETQKISRLKLDPDKIVESARFRSLKPYINITQPKNAGRNNPFMGL